MSINYERMLDVHNKTQYFWLWVSEKRSHCIVENIVPNPYDEIWLTPVPSITPQLIIGFYQEFIFDHRTIDEHRTYRNLFLNTFQGFFEEVERLVIIICDRLMNEAESIGVQPDAEQ